jgi:hypothetical protein
MFQTEIEAAAEDGGTSENRGETKRRINTMKSVKANQGAINATKVAMP